MKDTCDNCGQPFTVEDPPVLAGENGRWHTSEVLPQQRFVSPSWPDLHRWYPKGRS